MSRENPLIGKVVMAVYLAEDGGAIRFDIEGGNPVIARADGDCYSQSWVEEVQGIEQLIGARVVSIEDVGDMPEKKGNRYDHYEEEMAYYGCKITTDKGYALIDYRNSSNGYYGGNLSWPHENYFYGGVHGQNVSKETWKKVEPHEV
jgi:hypothetical protein